MVGGGIPDGMAEGNVYSFAAQLQLCHCPVLLRPVVIGLLEVLIPTEHRIDQFHGENLDVMAYREIVFPRPRKRTAIILGLGFAGRLP